MNITSVLQIGDVDLGNINCKEHDILLTGTVSIDHLLPELECDYFTTLRSPVGDEKAQQFNYTCFVHTMAEMMKKYGHQFLN